MCQPDASGDSVLGAGHQALAMQSSCSPLLCKHLCKGTWRPFQLGQQTSPCWSLTSLLGLELHSQHFQHSERRLWSVLRFPNRWSQQERWERTRGIRRGFHCKALPTTPPPFSFSVLIVLLFISVAVLFSVQSYCVFWTRSQGWGHELQRELWMRVRNNDVLLTATVLTTTLNERINSIILMILLCYS